jgi:adenosyl cobinamide kinase/adenosyl cobinamide phosphate guanylyltransferase
MAARIARHRAERPPAWVVVEEPLDLGGALGRAPDSACVIVDCLTLWTANLMGAGRAEADILGEASEVAGRAAGRAGPTVVVSNEVGLGVHPATPVGREYRDLLGRVNARWADVAATALLLVAGRALALARPEEVLR